MIDYEKKKPVCFPSPLQKSSINSNRNFLSYLSSWMLKQILSRYRATICSCLCFMITIILHRDISMSIIGLNFSPLTISECVFNPIRKCYFFNTTLATPLGYIHGFLIIFDMHQQLDPVGSILSDKKKSDQWNSHIHI